MKTVKYLGEDVNLGRFGNIVTDQIIDMTELEWAYIVKNGDSYRYTLLDIPLSGEELKQALKIKPYGTDIFDLRTIPWENENLPKSLEARFSTRDLLKVVTALSIIGAKVRNLPDMERRFLVADAIVECGDYHQWSKLSKEDRMILPLYSEVEDRLDLTKVEEIDYAASKPPKAVRTRTRTRKQAAPAA